MNFIIEDYGETIRPPRLGHTKYIASDLQTSGTPMPHHSKGPPPDILILGGGNHHTPAGDLAPPHGASYAWDNCPCNSLVGSFISPQLANPYSLNQSWTDITVIHEIP